MIIFKISSFKLSDIDQGINKHALQKKWEFSAFLKKLLFCEKEKKSNNSVSKNTLCTQKIKFCKKIFFPKMFVYV